MHNSNKKYIDNKRDNGLDLLRVVATLAVILIHVNWLYFGTKYDKVSTTTTWNVEALINIVTRFSVPAFVMITGAFQINEKSVDSAFYKKAIRKVFFPALIVLVLLACYRVFANYAKGDSLLYGLDAILDGSFFNLWYVYMLCGLYAMIPFIYRIKASVSFMAYKTITAILMIWACMSQAFSDSRIAYSIGVVGAFTSYLLMGDVLYTTLNEDGYRSRWKTLIKHKFILVCIAAVCVMISFFVRKNGNTFYVYSAYRNFFSPTIVLFSICVFALFTQLKHCIDMRVLAKYSFGIYLFHTFVLYRFENVVKTHITNDLIGIAVIFLLTFAISFILSVTFNKLYKILIR